MLSDTANVPHWYILTYIGSHRDAEKRLAKVDLPSFVPVFFAQDLKKESAHDYQYFSNYAFVLGTQNQIYQQKLTVLRTFNFMPKNYGKDRIHPYVEEYVIKQLRRIEEINGGKIPFLPYPSDVIVGDTIRILTGQFKDHEATAIRKNGSKYRDIVFDVAGKFLIPLCKLRVGEYEIVKYGKETNGSATVKVTTEDVTFLRDALERHYRIKPADESCLSQDRTKTENLVERYRKGTPATHLQRVRISLFLVMAYTILENNEEQLHYIKHTLNLIQEKCSLALKANVYCNLYGCTFNGEYYSLYIATRKEALGTKEESAISKINEVMNLYSRWNIVLHPRQSRYTLECDTTDAQWFALELLSPMDEVAEHLKEKGIMTYNPEVKSHSNKSVLLAHSTFEALRKILITDSLFAFMRDTRDNQDVPLYLTDTEVTDYRHVMDTASEDLQHLDLTPECDALFSKSKPTTVPFHGREVHGIIGTSRIKRTTQQRLIIYLRHLTALAIPL